MNSHEETVLFASPNYRLKRYNCYTHRRVISEIIPSYYWLIPNTMISLIKFARMEDHECAVIRKRQDEVVKSTPEIQWTLEWLHHSSKQIHSNLWTEYTPYGHPLVKHDKTHYLIFAFQTIKCKCPVCYPQIIEWLRKCIYLVLRILVLSIMTNLIKEKSIISGLSQTFVC